MSDVAFDQFRAGLSRHIQEGDLQQEVLRHEMSATINRHRLTGQQEGVHSFNTNQLCWLVMTNPDWSREHFLVVGLLLSTLIDDQNEIFFDAIDKGILPASWTWISWAKGFQGNEEELLQKLTAISDGRARCGAACLATSTNSLAIGSHLLGEFRQPALAKVYHRLLTRALSQPKAHKVALSELNRLAVDLEVLFASDTDATIAALVHASDLDNPETMVAPFKDAASEWTRTAIARRHLERGRPAQALALIKDLRFLSPAYDQAVMVATLAALENKEFQKAEMYSRSIADDEARLKVMTRIAQATGDLTAEIDALSKLYEIQPHDPSVFMQLIKSLIRTDQMNLVAALCADAQERFNGNQQVDTIIQRFLAKR